MKNLRSVFYCLAMIGFSSIASARAGDPEKNLAHVDAFAFGGIGAAGTASEGEIEFREILAGRDAAGNFRKLLDFGNREAKCYALVGLRKLDPKGFAALAAPFKEMSAKVKTIGGCMIMDQSMSAVVARIAKGNYDVYLDRKLHP